MNVNIKSNLSKFTYTDANGEVVAYFYMNPTDFRIAQRAKDAAKYFKEKKKAVAGAADLDTLIQYDKELTEKINYLLGYDASSTLFGFMSATTIMEDGRLFASVVLNTIAENIGKALQSRVDKLSALRKHTRKYE